jgi:hypothetical protein
MRTATTVFAATTLLLGAVFLLAPKQAAPPAIVPSVVVDERPAARIEGLWSRYESVRESDPLRFYYFHTAEGEDARRSQGIGLYRYGKVGYNTTNSFNYEIDGEALTLIFRKTGERHQIKYRIEADASQPGREWLILEGDPREHSTVRYFRARGGMQEDASQPLFMSTALTGHDARSAAPQSDGIGGRLWIDLQRFATGGMAFSLYQLKDGAIDGRGVGWHHIGDFDDWSTESLTFRATGQRLDLAFTLRGERAVTHFSLQEENGARTLVLDEDPRGFWHEHRFKDAGPSF